MRLALVHLSCNQTCSGGACATGLEFNLISWPADRGRMDFASDARRPKLEQEKKKRRPEEDGRKMEQSGQTHIARQQQHRLTGVLCICTPTQLPIEIRNKLGGQVGQVGRVASCRKKMK